MSTLLGLIQIPSFKSIFRGKSMYRKMNKRNSIIILSSSSLSNSLWRLHGELRPIFFLLAELHLQERRGMMSWDQYTFLENCPPTPPLRQHFALSEK